MTKDKTALSYKDAGVDIDAGDALVRALKPAAKATARAGVEPSLGGFGAIFDPRAAGYDDPILVAGTDGVGTKLKLAFEAGRYDTIGVDLVAMCANDVVVQGAEPLFFLDYFATSKLDVNAATEVIAGIAEGCKEAGCALIGGETAEMPGLYQAGEFDLAGFVVGAAERGSLLRADRINPGDIILGLASNGAHSNGFSLIRRILARESLSPSDTAPFDSTKTVAESFLTPTRLYVRACLAAVRAGKIKGLAHITGGGLLENLPRCLPAGTMACLEAKAWALPAVFQWLQEAGKLSKRELARTFNCGIGMAVIVAPEACSAVERLLTEQGETVHRIGQIEESPDAASVQIHGEAGLWGASKAWTVETGGD